jgi:hypothetical protein
MISHHPEGDEECEECENMSEQNDSFGKREVVSGEDVEGNRSEGKSEYQERYLPGFDEWGIWVRYSDHLLYHACTRRKQSVRTCDEYEGRTEIQLSEFDIPANWRAHAGTPDIHPIVLAQPTA